MAGPSRHQVVWVASALQRAAAGAGVALSVDYSRRIAAEGLQREPQLGVTRLGAGVVIHTVPALPGRLPTVLGYADGGGQWYRDGRRHPTETVPSVAAEPEPLLPVGVGL
jgi:hypothetical protein